MSICRSISWNIYTYVSLYFLVSHAIASFSCSFLYAVWYYICLGVYLILLLLNCWYYFCLGAYLSFCLFAGWPYFCLGVYLFAFGCVVWFSFLLWVFVCFVLLFGIICVRVFFVFCLRVCCLSVFLFADWSSFYVNIRLFVYLLVGILCCLGSVCVFCSLFGITYVCFVFIRFSVFNICHYMSLLLVLSHFESCNWFHRHLKRSQYAMPHGRDVIFCRWQVACREWDSKNSRYKVVSVPAMLHSTLKCTKKRKQNHKVIFSSRREK